MDRLIRLTFFLLVLQGITVWGFLENCNMEACMNSQLKQSLDEVNWLPTTEEQINTLCPPALSVRRCVSEAIQNCTGKTMTELSTSNNIEVAIVGNGLDTIGNFTLDICTQGSDLRKNYVASIPCIKDLVMNQHLLTTYLQEGNTVYARYMLRRSRAGDRIPNGELKSLSWCISVSYALERFATTINTNCGEVAQTTFLSTFGRFHPFNWNECTDSSNIQNKTSMFFGI